MQRNLLQQLKKYGVIESITKTHHQESNMTLLQKRIRSTVAIQGSMSIRVGRSSPAHMGTVRALMRANYKCVLIGKQQDCDVWEISR
jgi:hypothetical protein